MACSGGAEISGRCAHSTPFDLPPGVDTEIPQTRLDRQSSRPPARIDLRGG